MEEEKSEQFTAVFNTLNVIKDSTAVVMMVVNKLKPAGCDLPWTYWRISYKHMQHGDVSRQTCVVSMRAVLSGK